MGIHHWAVFSLTKDQWCGKCFNVITPSWCNMQNILSRMAFDIVPFGENLKDGRHIYVDWMLMIYALAYQLFVENIFLRSNMYFYQLLLPSHYDVIKSKHFPRYWPIVRGIHRSPVNSPHKGQWRGALMFSLICVWINGWVNNREAGDLRRFRAHYDVIVMRSSWLFWKRSSHPVIPNATTDDLEQ